MHILGKHASNYSLSPINTYYFRHLKKEKFSLWRPANSNYDFLPLIQRSANVNKEVGSELSSSCRNKSGGSSWAGLNEISEELYFTQFLLQEKYHNGI